MRRALCLLAAWEWVGLLTGALSLLASGQTAEILLRETPEGYEVRYFSGKTGYLEGLRAGRWLGCGWSADGRRGLDKLWESEAFELQIKDQPTPPAVPETRLSGGWKWVGYLSKAAAEAGSAHGIVHLKHQSLPVELRVHTRVDGTGVLVRWLEITNASAKPIALVGCKPWCGRLWSTGGPIAVGHSLKWEVPREGWFGWTELREGENVFKQDRGLTWDDPFFVLRNDAKGEYFFGQLAWPASYIMEFHKDQGLAFQVGPIAANALRVMNSGETITSPAVHLGCVRGDFDAAVQAMHDHVRQSVVPKRKPEHTTSTRPSAVRAR